MSELPLAAEFPDRSRADWQALVDEALKGADFDKRLVTRTADGIRIEPLYSAGDAGHSIAPRPAGGPWIVAEAHGDPDPARANAAILAGLAAGAGAIVLPIAQGSGAPGIGIWTVEDLGVALKDVRLDALPVHLAAGARSLEAAALYLSYTERAGTDPATLTGSFGIDPASMLARDGALPLPFAAICDAAAALAGSDTAMRAMTVSTQAFHAAGASEAQELAVSLAAAVQYLRGLEAAGLDLETAERAIRFVLTADADVFLTIAKFRSLRALWARVREACGLEGPLPPCDGETAWRMATTRDAAVNMLRATAATFAAATGGAQTITVAPYTAALGLPDGFARRIARNTQTILAEESNIARVADAGAGSWYLESLTSELAGKAWTLFQEIEAEGGLIAALEAGTLQTRIAQAAGARRRAIAHRKQPITGVSEFPDLEERKPRVLDAAPAEAPEFTEAGDWQGLMALARDGAAPGLAGASGETCSALTARRLSEPFEALRRAAETGGEPPRIFLATLGGPADHTARASFARNFFGAGGIEAVTAETEGDDLGHAFELSRARIACICSSDAVYKTHGTDAARALKDAGASRVLLAGRPGPLERDLEAAGVDDFIFAGSDLLDILEDLHRHLNSSGAQGATT